MSVCQPREDPSEDRWETALRGMLSSGERSRLEIAGAP